MTPVSSLQEFYMQHWAIEAILCQWWGLIQGIFAHAFLWNEVAFSHFPLISRIINSNFQFLLTCSLWFFSICELAKTEYRETGGGNKKRFSEKEISFATLSDTIPIAFPSPMALKLGQYTFPSQMKITITYIKNVQLRTVTVTKCACHLSYGTEPTYPTQPWRLVSLLMPIQYTVVI